MIKELLFKKEKDDYVLCTNDGVIIKITNKKINAADIYDNIYSKLEENANKVEIKLKTALSEKEDTIIFNQLKYLFCVIDEAVNSQLRENDTIKDTCIAAK